MVNKKTYQDWTPSRSKKKTQVNYIRKDIKMKLHERIFMKITDKNKVYYLEYKSYANKHDGKISYKEINKKSFDMAKLWGYKIEEKEFEDARPGAKYRIKNNLLIGEDK